MRVSPSDIQKKPLAAPKQIPSKPKNLDFFSTGSGFVRKTTTVPKPVAPRKISDAELRDINQKGYEALNKTLRDIVKSKDPELLNQNRDTLKKAAAVLVSNLTEEVKREEALLSELGPIDTDAMAQQTTAEKQLATVQRWLANLDKK